MGGEVNQTSNNDLPYWVALSRCLKLGPTRFALLRGKFATMQQAWLADVRQLREAGLEPPLTQSLIAHRQTTDVKASWQQIEKLKLGVITIADPNYPKLLKQIHDPPPLLYYRGTIEGLGRTCLAVVGTRRATSYGLRVTNELVRDLAQAGLTIISGLAYGIDAAAHKATLEAHGTTVAVLASGLDQIYPAANQPLAEAIVASGGALISEFPPGTAPLKQNFPFRNRVIAGLARGTLVVEGAPGSGSLITARCALEQNREVFAVPGNIFSEQSRGTNELLALGAHLATSARDVLDVLGLQSLPTIALPPPTAAQEALLKYFSAEPRHLDDLVRASGLKAADFTANLSLLELAGYVRNVGGQQYVRIG